MAGGASGSLPDDLNHGWLRMPNTLILKMMPLSILQLPARYGNAPSMLRPLGVPVPSCSNGQGTHYESCQDMHRCPSFPRAGAALLIDPCATVLRRS